MLQSGSGASRIFLGGGLVATLCVCLAAQTPQEPTFRAAVTHVTTDVIPRDSQGRFIPDLTKDSSTILEDGVVQNIDSFALVHGGRTFNTIDAPAAPAPEGIILPTAPAVWSAIRPAACC